MKNILFAVFVLINASLFASFTPSQQAGLYQVHIDIKNIENDQVNVELVLPIIEEDSIEFHFARIIPGTYDIHNYGRFISKFSVSDDNADSILVKKLDDNRYRIYNARNAYKLTYKVDDTFDSELGTDIFEPAGTGISDKVVLLNNFGFIGYLDGYSDVEYELIIKHKQEHFGASSLIGEQSDTLDIFRIPNYFQVHDNPLLYCAPDTASKMVGGAKVIVSVYSPSGNVNATKALEGISDVLDAAANYLGGTLPVDKYAVLIYSVGLDEMGLGYGALEHQTNTVLYMPEFDEDQFYSGVSDITAHEFFHIVTPLGIHSEYINDFDFIEPEMSKHIWLYEGITEYNSQIVQIRDEIIGLDDFLDIIETKLETMDSFNPFIPLTVASKNTLSFTKDEYLNFYQKGAIAGLSLDLELMRLSNGEYRLVDLLNELGATYGPDTFFVDEDLFEIIVERTYPELKEFFSMHFESSVPFPLKEQLLDFGIDYKDEFTVERMSYGGFDFGYNPETERLLVQDATDLDAFGKDLGLMEGDEFISIQGNEVNLQNINKVLISLLEDTEVGEKVSFEVARKKGDGSFKKKKLKAKASTVKVKMKHLLEPIDEASSHQLKMRKAWINQ